MKDVRVGKSNRRCLRRYGPARSYFKAKVVPLTLIIRSGANTSVGMAPKGRKVEIPVFNSLRHGQVLPGIFMAAGSFEHAHIAAQLLHLDRRLGRLGPDQVDDFEPMQHRQKQRREGKRRCSRAMVTSFIAPQRLSEPWTADVRLP